MQNKPPQLFVYQGPPPGRGERHVILSHDLLGAVTMSTGVVRGVVSHSWMGTVAGFQKVFKRVKEGGK